MLVSLVKRGPTGVLHQNDQSDCFFSGRCVYMSNIRTTSGYAQVARHETAPGLVYIIYTVFTHTLQKLKKKLLFNYLCLNLLSLWLFFQRLTHSWVVLSSIEVGRGYYASDTLINLFHYFQVQFSLEIAFADKSEKTCSSRCRKRSITYVFSIFLG